VKKITILLCLFLGGCLPEEEVKEPVKPMLQGPIPAPVPVLEYPEPPPKVRLPSTSKIANPFKKVRRVGD